MKNTVRLLLLIGILGLGFSQETSAQILNIEKARMDNDTLEAFIGNATFNFTLKQRNTQLVSMRSILNLTHATKKHNYIFIGNLHLIKVEGRDVISDGSSHVRWNIMKRRKLSYEVFAQAQYDQARGMNHRFLFGGDVRFRLRHSDKITLAASTGAMYEKEDWFFQDVAATTELIKSTSYIAIQNRFSNRLEINCISYYQARFDDFFKPRVTADVNINIRITKLFSFNSTFQGIYDAAPVVPVRHLFYTFANGITLKF
ncbi:MAG: DUF481 domain-containing protein [Flammeovirgaceae bacterium]